MLFGDKKNFAWQKISWPIIHIEKTPIIILHPLWPKKIYNTSNFHLSPSSQEAKLELDVWKTMCNEHEKLSPWTWLGQIYFHAFQQSRGKSNEEIKQ